MRTSAFLIAALAATFATGSVRAADVYHMQQAPAYNSAAFNFDGFYLGAQGGGITGTYSSGSIGVVAGVNYDISDPILAGVEFQADWLPGVSSGSTFDFFALGRAGVRVADNLLVYGELGPGWVAGNSSYAIGGGGEFALTDVLSVKGEVQGIGAWGSGPSSARFQAGLIFHLQ